MTFDEYQHKAVSSAIYPDLHMILYPAVGVANEAGEMLGKVKKVLRGDHTFADAKTDIADEIGDVLWYCAALARDLGCSLDVIAAENIAKLKDRQKRGVIRGDGDKR